MAGSDLDQKKTKTPGIVIIGSGAGGAAAAWALTRLGMRVLVLEAGPAYDPHSDYRLASPDWERTGFPMKPGAQIPYSVAELQPLAPEYDHLRSWRHQGAQLNPGNRRLAAAYSHVAGTGGSTLHYTGEAHRMHPRAMRLKTDFGVGADWPLSYEELERFYLEAEGVIGVAGPENDPFRPRSAPCPLPEHDLSHASQRLGKAFDTLGLSWTPNNLAVASESIHGRPPCNYCGQCRRGCPRRDKGSADITFLHPARQTGLMALRTGANVTRIEAGPKDRVKGVHYRDGEGQEHFAPAEVVIVACGAVNTPRLLLMSQDSYAPDGLGNEMGQVGKNFMETLAWTSLGLHPDRLDGHRGLPADAICWSFNAPDSIPGVVGGCRFNPAQLEADIAGPLSYATRVTGGWGRKHMRRMRETFGHALGVSAIGECLPNPGSFIDLDPDRKDSAGQPIARIHSHLGEQELKRLDFMANNCREILAAAGVDELFEEYGNYDFFNTTHVFGSCRMGTDPDESVVNGDLRSHRWRNLFVMDASVFPSSGGGEAPSLTIAALAIRASRRLWEGKIS